MQEYFKDLSGEIFSWLRGKEILLLNYSGEKSDFVRINHNRIRQCGHVQQQSLGMTIILGQKQCAADIQLTGCLSQDRQNISAELSRLQQQVALLPSDPYLNYNTQTKNSLFVNQGEVPSADQVVEQLLAVSDGLDLVGIWASGEIERGFANSLGQFNWHSQRNFNFDWSVYLKDDKAVKQSYAGTQWQLNKFAEKINRARETLDVLRVAPKLLKPGKYRVYLSPDALHEILGLLGWGGFGLKSHRTAQTPLLKMVEDGVRLSDQLTLTEEHAQGMAPAFTGAGYLKPGQVKLIENGNYGDCLSDARSAKEYGVDVNCHLEAPQSLFVSSGELAIADALAALGTGVWISNLWYCNYSDRNNARITGMTRFACLWVENGKVVAPIGVMRFDESVFQMLGENLEHLTRERDWILDNHTYGQRSTASACVPGALINNFSFTL